jgi:hypothetical protein
MVWQAVVERFEQKAPASVMARLALEQALPAHWIDEVHLSPDGGDQQWL